MLLQLVDSIAQVEQVRYLNPKSLQTESYALHSIGMGYWGI